MPSVRTTCPYCGVGCGLVARTSRGRLAAVEGDRLHPVNRGATCRKPLHLPDAVHAPDRATTPLLRDGPDERWRPVTWRRVIPHLARRLRAIADEHGPDAIAFYVSGQLLTEDYYAVNKLVKGYVGTNNVDSNSRLCMSSAVAAYRETFGSDGPPGCYADIDHADCILLLGTNTAACHPIVWARIRRRQSEGARLVVIDPRRTETAAAADLHLPVRPGADLALLNSMVHVIEREGLVDRRFLALRTEGAEGALAAAADWPPERAAGETGVAAELIVEAARTFAGATRALALWSMGANQSTVGTLKNRALHNLCLLTGNFGQPGAGPLSLTGQPNAMGGRESGGLSTLLPGYRSVADAEDRAEMRRLWNLPADLPGIAPEPGLAATELADALHDGRVRAVWVVATNPVVSQPDAERFAAGLRRAELVVVQDAYHPTETAALAHVALPAAQWPEKDGVMTNSERGVSLVQRAIDPPGAALPDWEVFARLGRALGHGDAFAWGSASDVFDEYAATTAGRLCDVTGLSHERLRREGVVQWPCPARAEGREQHPGTQRLYASGGVPTPSGKARLAATPHAPPADAVDDSFPLLLTTGRLPGQWHTMTRTGKSPELMHGETGPSVELHPKDARRVGVRDGQAVRLVSRRGVATMRARIVETLPEGVTFAPFHWGALHLAPGELALNEVTSPALDPVSLQAELKATAVRVERLESPASRAAPAAGGERTLVVGGGMAGLAVVEQLLAHGAPSGVLTIVGAEREAPYDRIRLSQALAGEATGRELLLREASWFEERGVELRSGAAVADLGLAERRATLSDGAAIEYDRAVIATGSRPMLPPIRGLHRRGVHPFRSLRDVSRILAAPGGGRPAVVIGGGLLGLEAARGLQARGMRVTVVHLAGRLMEQQLDPLGAGLLERRLRQLGIDILLEASTTELAGNGRVEAVRLADGTDLDAELVIVATGIRPNVELAQRAGIDVAGGVVVDDELRASAPGVWAVGECVEHRGQVYGLWAPLLRQARVAAAVMSGRPAAFHGAVAATTLKVMGIDLFCAGRAEPRDDEEQVLSLDSRRGRYRKLVVAGDRLVGAVLLGDLGEAATLRRLIEDRRPVPAELLDGSAPAPAPVSGLVCSCASVTREQIDAAARAGGLERVAEIARATGATTGCGGCRAAVERILAERPRETLRDARRAPGSR